MNEGQNEFLYIPGEDNQERITIPGLDQNFYVDPALLSSIETMERVVNVNELSRANKSRSELALSIRDLIVSVKNLIGFKWVVKNPKLILTVAKNAEVNKRINDEDLYELLYTMLRFRAIIKEINWDFTKKYFEITSVNI